MYTLQEWRYGRVSSLKMNEESPLALKAFLVESALLSELIPQSLEIALGLFPLTLVALYANTILTRGGDGASPGPGCLTWGTGLTRCILYP